MTMPLAPEVLALAQKGNPKVLAAVINHAMRTYGVRAQVMRREPDLHILLEAEQIPEEDSSISFVESLLRSLGVEAVEAVRVYGHRVGENAVAWRRSLTLRDLFPQTESSSEPEISTPQSFPEQQIAEAPEAETAGAEVAMPVVSEVSPSNPEEPLSTLSESVSIPSPEALAPQALKEIGFVNPFVLSPDDPIVEQSMPEEEFVKLVKAEVVEDPNFRPIESQEFVRRPESVVLLVMLSLLAFWRFYLELAAEPENTLTTRELAERLGVKRKTVRHRKYQTDFAEWSRSLDPDEIAWKWEEGRFRPLVAVN